MQMRRDREILAVTPGLMDKRSHEWLPLSYSVYGYDYSGPAVLQYVLC